MRATFHNQPLTEAGLRLTFKEILPIGPDFVIDLNSELDKSSWLLSRSDLYENPPGAGVVVFVDRMTFLDRFSLAALKISHYRNGVTIYLQENMLGVRWRGASAKEYPRFEALLEAVGYMREKIAGTAGTFPEVPVVNLFYKNIFDIESNEVIFQYLEREFLPTVRLGELLSSESVWRTNICELRVKLGTETLENGRTRVTLESVGGSLLKEDEDPAHVLSRINLELNRVFLTLLTERTKQEWQLQRT